jgi:hypothetical protein
VPKRSRSGALARNAVRPYGRIALVKGGAGAVVEIGGVVRGVAGFTVVDGRIVEIDLMLDPEKLRRVSVD